MYLSPGGTGSILVRWTTRNHHPAAQQTSASRSATAVVLLPHPPGWGNEPGAIYLTNKPVQGERGPASERRCDAPTLRKEGDAATLRRCGRRVTLRRCRCRATLWRCDAATLRLQCDAATQRRCGRRATLRRCGGRATLRRWYTVGLGVVYIRHVHLGAFSDCFSILLFAFLIARHWVCKKIMSYSSPEWID